MKTAIPVGLLLMWMCGALAAQTPVYGVPGGGGGTGGPATPTGAAGGDLTGTYPNPGVGQVNGAALPPGAPYVGTNAAGQVVTAANPPGAAALPYTPLALYKMNQTTGYPQDTSGNGYNCTASAGTAPTWTGTGRSYAGGHDTCPPGAINNAETVTFFFYPAWAQMKNAVSPSNYPVLFSADGASQLTLPEAKYTGGFGLGTASGYWELSDDKYQGFVSLTLVLGATPAAYINGQPVKTLTTTAWSGGTMPAALTATSAFTLASFSAGQPGFSGVIAGVATFTQALTAAQVAQVDVWGQVNIFQPRGIVRGGDPTDYSKACIVYAGDSIYANSSNSSFFYNAAVSYASGMLGDTQNYWNVAIGGHTLAEMLTEYTTQVAPIFNQCNGLNKILITNIGVNDLSGTSTTGAALYSEVQTYAGYVHAQGVKFIASTVLPNGGLTVANGKEAQRQIYNNDILGDWLNNTTGDFDWINDRAGNPLMGSQAALTYGPLTYYYGDHTHPTGAGNQVLGTQDDAFAVNSVAGNGSKTWPIKRQVPAWVLATAPTAGSSPMTINLLQLGPRQKLAGSTVHITTAYAGSGITAMSCSIGDSTGTATQYSQPLNFMAVGTGDYLSTFASTQGIVQLICTTTGGVPSALTAGVADVSLEVVTQ